MSTGTVNRNRRRIVVEFSPALGDAIDSAVADRAKLYGHATASDVVREAVARFLLPFDGTNGNHRETDTNQEPTPAGSLSHG